MSDEIHYYNTPNGPELFPDDHDDRLSELTGALLASLPDEGEFRGVLYDLANNSELPGHYKHRLAVDAIATLAQYILVKGDTYQATFFGSRFVDAKLLIGRHLTP